MHDRRLRYIVLFIAVIGVTGVFAYQAFATAQQQTVVSLVEKHSSYFALNDTTTTRVADVIVHDDTVVLSMADVTELVVDQVTENNNNNNNDTTTSTAQNNNQTMNNTSIQYIYQGVAMQGTNRSRGVLRKQEIDYY